MLLLLLLLLLLLVTTKGGLCRQCGRGGGEVAKAILMCWSTTSGRFAAAGHPIGPQSIAVRGGRGGG